MVVLQTPLGAGKERASSCRVVFFRGLLGCLLVSFVVCFGFFSGSRVFLLGFLVGFGLGPLGVFFGFFSFFLCWLWLLVYTSGVLRGALRFLINLLTYQKKDCSNLFQQL
jgi:hypothetical protein